MLLACPRVHVMMKSRIAPLTGWIWTAEMLSGESIFINLKRMSSSLIYYFSVVMRFGTSQTLVNIRSPDFRVRLESVIEPTYAEAAFFFLENVIICENRQSPCMLLLLRSQSRVPSSLSQERLCIYHMPYMPLTHFCVRIFFRGIVRVQLGGPRLSQRGSSLDSPSAFKYLRTCHNDLNGVFPLHELCPAYPSS